MRILLDECVPARVRAAFPGHAVKTVTESGWRSVKDENLLPFAEKQFDVFLTVDKRIQREQARHRFRLGILIVHVRSNAFPDFLPLFPDLLSAALTVRPGQVLHIGQSTPRAI